MYSETPDIIAFDTSHKRRILTEEQLETLKEGTLWLLEEVGVHFPSQMALEIFADHGAKVDFKAQIVHIPPDIVLKALATAPRSFVLGGREERFDIVLDGKRSYLATDGCGVHVIDLETRERRASRKSDVAMMARVSDALPLISFFWPLVSAQDYGETARLHEAHAGITNTLKHVRGGSTMHPRLAPYLVEMATAVAGSEEERRKRPIFNANICTIAPLSQDRHGIETALVFAEAGIPTSMMAMTTMGSTAPATPLGAIVVGDAEVISALVLLQLACPGAPVFHSIYVSLMDPQTGGYSPNYSAPAEHITVELAHAWNLPSLGGGSVSSDAQEIGWKSGSDAAHGALTIPLTGGEICGYLGMLGSSMILYPEAIILEHELCLQVYETFHNFEFNPNDLSLEVIKEVGPSSHFLSQQHTRKHIRDFRLSSLFREKDSEGNLRDPREIAVEEFKRLNENHKPEPLPRDVSSELDRIMAAADREAQKLT
jgi:trimethylamine--corrinoid protein Co-methyltransferase